MGAPEAEALLTHLAVKENVAASTQNPCTERSERILNRGGLAVRSPLD